MRHVGSLLNFAFFLGSGRTISRIRSEDAATTRPFCFSAPSTRYCPTAKPTTTPFLAAAKKRKDDAEERSRDSTGNQEASYSNETPPPTQKRSEEEERAILGYAIDSFLRGDYNLKLSGNSKPLPPPDLGPGSVVSTALRSLRGQDLPSQTHGAAVFMRFCLPLRRSERWGDASSVGKDPWKEVLRGGLTANTLVRRIRASDFFGLLDWNRLV